MYSVGQDYCGADSLADCASVVSTIDSTDVRVWSVYAMFTGEQQPDLRGVEFGIIYDADIVLLGHGACGDLEIATPGWPQNGGGTQVVWAEGQSSQATCVYWFAGYAYAEPTARVAGSTFAVGPHPQFGGHFGDGSIVPIIDEIADYGVLGFGVEGYAPCPMARTFRIRADGSGDYPTIKDAMDVAAPGSVIELEDGVYRGDGNRDLDFNNTAMTLRSVSGNPEACVIDCEGTVADNHRGIFVDLNHDIGPVVEGIKIINGHVGSNGHWSYGGGGIDLTVGSRLVVVNCIVEACTSDIAGGGVGSGGGTIEMEGCIIRGNWTAGQSGGGLSAVDARIRLRDCRFEGNFLTGSGGAIRLTGCDLEAIGCVFQNNRAIDGGAITIRNTRALFEGCTWAANTSTNGATFRIDDSPVVFDHVTFASNQAARAAAIHVGSGQAPEIRGSILAFGEPGPAVLCSDAPVIAATDIYGNAGGDWVGCLEGLLETGRNLHADPLFCGLDGLDLSLDSRSPCVRRADFVDPVIGAWPVGCGPTWAPLLRSESAMSNPALVTVTHNPSRNSVQFHGEGLVEGSSVTLDIYDLSGRTIGELPVQVGQSGRFDVIWNGRTMRGSRAPAGMYFGVLRGVSGRATVQFTFVR
ncbi:MAG: FlgD immunoglobulin-like domain containing protein [Candidatus Eisenbacteria bacterium]